MHPYLPLNFQKQAGNALFLILIAVALFAALSYAVTQTGRGSGSIGKEQAALYAAQIVSMGNMVKQGVQRMVLMGTPATSIIAGSPDNLYPGTGTLNSGTEPNAANFCTTGTNCLFAPTEGGVTIPVLPKTYFATTPPSWLPNFFTGPSSYNGILICQFSNPALSCAAVAGLGTASNEVALTVFPLKQEICAAINKGLGISGIPSGPQGSLGTGSTAALAGLESFCFFNTDLDSGMYEYAQILVVN